MQHTDHFHSSELLLSLGAAAFQAQTHSACGVGHVSNSSDAEDAWMCEQRWWCHSGGCSQARSARLKCLQWSQEVAAPEACMQQAARCVEWSLFQTAVRRSEGLLLPEHTQTCIHVQMALWSGGMCIRACAHSMLAGGQHGCRSAGVVI